MDFGYLFSRVIHFYGIGYRELLDMPIRCFWELSKNINRISAQEDMRGLSISCYCQDGEAASKYREHLELEMGRVFEYTIDIKQERLDREGLKALKASIKKR